MAEVAHIGIGSNIDASQNSIRCLDELSKDKRLAILALSSLYLSSPVSPVTQNDFLNCVVKVLWEGTIIELLDHLQSIENRMGRKRDVFLGPRTIDLDVLFFGETVLDAPRLIVPHPRLHQRKFALVPCLEIDPDFVHPVLKRRLSDLLSDLGPDQEIRIYRKAGWYENKQA
jgi:2-amino-4-hydroxy-6-hydroxymethyldihydropteridine diphosphokinase